MNTSECCAFSNNTIHLFINDYIAYIQPSIFNKPKPLSFNIVLPSKAKSEAPLVSRTPKPSLRWLNTSLTFLLIRSNMEWIHSLLLTRSGRTCFQTLFSNNSQHMLKVLTCSMYPLALVKHRLNGGELSLAW